MAVLFAYLAGLLTLLNPCVLPVLPIVLTSAMQANRRAPLALAAGLSGSFVVAGVLVTAFGHLIGLTPDALSKLGAWLMIGFGLVLLVPAAETVLATAGAGLATRADARFDALAPDGMLHSHVLGGVLLGVVWSPCIGPSLGGAIALASQGQSLGWAAVILLGFALGVSTMVLGLAWLVRRARPMRKLPPQVVAAMPRVMGAAFVCVGGAILFKWHYVAEAWLLDMMPDWLVRLTVAF